MKIKSLFFVCLSLFLVASSSSAQFEIKDTYWVYERESKKYISDIQRAAKEGIDSKTQKLTLSLKVALSEDEYTTYIQGKGEYPVYVQWYRYNRAKLSVFAVDKVPMNKIYKVTQNGKTYYQFYVTQEDILTGTWIVKFNDTDNKILNIQNQTQFDVIVL